MVEHSYAMILLAMFSLCATRFSEAKLSIGIVLYRLPFDTKNFEQLDIEMNRTIAALRKGEPGVSRLIDYSCVHYAISSWELAMDYSSFEPLFNSHSDLRGLRISESLLRIHRYK